MPFYEMVKNPQAHLCENTLKYVVSIPWISFQKSRSQSQYKDYNFIGLNPSLDNETMDTKVSVSISIKGLGFQKSQSQSQ